MTRWAAHHPDLPDADGKGPYSFVYLCVRQVASRYIIPPPAHRVNAQVEIAINYTKNSGHQSPDE